MIDLRRADGNVVVTTDGYRLEIDEVQPVAVLSELDGDRRIQLMLLTSIDSDHGLDGTVSSRVDAIEASEDSVDVTLEVVSTVWTSKQIRLRCTEGEVTFQVTIHGNGRLTNARLLGGSYTGNPRWGSGTFHSSWPARTLFVPSPDDPRRLVQPASEAATIGIVGGDAPGRGHWFFTPGPFLLAGSSAVVDDPDDASAAPWQVMELRADVLSSTFTELRYEPFMGGFSLVLSYEAETAVDGSFETPVLAIRLGASNPYQAVREHSDRLRANGLAPVVRRNVSEWWTKPIFCGWGEQFRQWKLHGGHPATYSRHDLYDEWLGILREKGIVPGTITIDDKWQVTYGRNEVDEERWPELRGWIAERHAGGQRVLLWFKAWDPDGLPLEACVTDSTGLPLAVDPESAGYQAVVVSMMQEMLGPGGLDADGLKVDFTARMPAGPGLRHAGDVWGVTLLHRLLTVIYRAAKAAKPDALVVTHTPNPVFADVTDMLRLNDLLRLSDPDPWAPAVPQMRHRARIASAIDPGLLIDTDDWCMPSKSEWRAYLDAKPQLGVPALYYATGIDHSNEAFDDSDYAAIRDAWARYAARDIAA